MSIIRRHLIWVLVAALALAGILARVGFASRPWRAYRAQRLPFDARMTALGTLGAGELAKMTSMPAVELKAACAGKLRQAEPQALLAYFGKLPPELAGLRSELPEEELYGSGLGYSNPILSLHFQAVPFSRDPYSALSLWDFVFDKSNEWSGMIDRFKASSPQADLGRYLLVHRIEKAKLLEVFEDGTFTPGIAALQVRALDASSGEMLCEGKTVTRSAGKITSHGRGTTKERAAGMAKVQLHSGTMVALGKAMKVAAMDVLCETGGERLCKSTNAEIENVEVFR